MLRPLGWLTLVLVLAMPVLARAEEGKLAEVREDVRTGDDDNKSADKPSSICDQDDDSEFWDTVCGYVLPMYGAGVAESFALPFLFPRHPYANDFPGYVRRDYNEGIRRQGEFLPELANTKLWSIRLGFEEGNDFDGLNRLGGQVLLDTSTRFGLAFHGNLFHERSDGRWSDDLFIGDLNLVFSLLRFPEIQDRIGVGVRFLNDDFDTNYGVNFLYAGDLFLAKPVIVSWTVDGGTLGEAGVFHARGSFGYAHSHGEAFIGYDYLRIGSAELQGPMVGLRVWF